MVKEKDLRKSSAGPTTMPEKAQEAGQTLQRTFATALEAIMEQGLVAPIRRASQLAKITGRHKQTTLAWLKKSPDTGGSLPDLVSFASIVAGFNVDAHYLLGLGPFSKIEERAPDSVPNVETGGSAEFEHVMPAVRDVIESATRRCDRMGVRKMAGDGMLPDIADGAMVFYDESIQTITSDGVYVVDMDGNVVVRVVQSLPGKIEISATNPRYKPVTVKKTSGEVPSGLRIVGKVVGWLQPNWIG